MSKTIILALIIAVSLALAAVAHSGKTPSDKFHAHIDCVDGFEVFASEGTTPLQLKDSNGDAIACGTTKRIVPGVKSSWEPPMFISYPCTSGQSTWSLDPLDPGPQDCPVHR